MSAYKQGQTADEIVDDFPTVTLPEVYGVIAYYLQNIEKVEAYLQRREEEAALLREKIEARQGSQEGLRERLLARHRQKQTAIANSTTVEIVPYQESWPQEFVVIGQALRGALGDRALRIDHIGSTAVPGLAAKDIIDIQITVASLVPVEPLDEALATIGFSRRLDVMGDHRPPGDTTSPDEAWAKYLCKPPDGHRLTNVHIRVQGAANQRYALLFRDYLRARPGSAAAYAETKRRLAHFLPDNRHAYVTIKDPVCDLIATAAEAWAAAINWRPGPSDIP
ncbi:MAG: GrpB family protein [Chloroflexi bacterium]|nr:GrpB family protein [Chloroflexota bacterium]MBP8054500.1 GrpB family protein [Chloroflexota bacterium]